MAVTLDYDALVAYFTKDRSSPYALYKLFDLLYEVDEKEHALKFVKTGNNLKFIATYGKDKGDQYSCYNSDTFARKVWHLEDRELCLELLTNKDLGLDLADTIWGSSEHKVYNERWVECLKVIKSRIVEEYNDSFYDGQIRSIDRMIAFEEKQKQN